MARRPARGSRTAAVGRLLTVRACGAESTRPAGDRSGEHRAAEGSCRGNLDGLRRPQHRPQEGFGVGRTRGQPEGERWQAVGLDQLGTAFGFRPFHVGTFSSRIDLAYPIGLISSQFARDLHLIRRMRNDIAHSIVARTFSDPGVADQVLHLVRSLGIQTRCSFLLKPPYDGTRGAFIVCIMVIISGLDAEVRTTDPITQLVVDPVYTTPFKDSASGA